MANAPAIGTFWRNKRSGVVAKVIGIERDCVRLSRPKMRETLKWLDHFADQYVEAEKPIPLTPERFTLLLETYVGARDHLLWQGNRSGTSTKDFELAESATAEARANLVRAVFP